MTLDVTAGVHTLMAQASMTADTYMRDAVERIDRLCGPGYAVKNPSLIAAFMQVAAADFGVAMSKAADQDIRDALHSIADAFVER